MTTKKKNEAKKKVAKKTTAKDAVKAKRYRVAKPIWLCGVQRYPGYELTTNDIGYLNATKGKFEYVLKDLKAVEAF